MHKEQINMMFNDKEQAKGITYCRKSYQFIGHSWILQRAISNARLNKRELISTLAHYQKVHTLI